MNPVTHAPAAIFQAHHLPWLGSMLVGHPNAPDLDALPAAQPGHIACSGRRLGLKTWLHEVALQARKLQIIGHLLLPMGLERRQDAAIHIAPAQLDALYSKALSSTAQVHHSSFAG